MAKLNWTPRAIDDLTAIAEFIAQDSRKFARVTIKRIRERTGQLTRFPVSGRVVPDQNDETVRELIHGNYRILYRVISKERIDIMAIHHTARALNIED